MFFDTDRDAVLGLLALTGHLFYSLKTHQWPNKFSGSLIVFIQLLSLRNGFFSHKFRGEVELDNALARVYPKQHFNARHIYQLMSQNRTLQEGNHDFFCTQPSVSHIRYQRCS